MKSINNLPTIRSIQEIVAAHFGLTMLDLLSDRRSQREARPRQIAMWLARHTTLCSIPVIAKHFGNRDHTTALHAIKRVDELRSVDPQFACTIVTLLQRVNNGESGETHPHLRIVA